MRIRNLKEGFDDYIRLVKTSTGVANDKEKERGLEGCSTLTCVVTIRIVDKENYKYFTPCTKLFTFRTKGLTSVHGQMSVRRTKTLPSS
jgi:hypothetical protein